MRFTTLAMILPVAALSLAACGSDAAKQAATATKGDKFCTAAEKVNAESSAFSGVALSGKPADVEAGFNKLLGLAQAALKVAPADIKAVVQTNVDNEVKVGQALKKYNWDFLKAAQDPAVKAMFDGASGSSKEIDSYLSSKCGIATDTTDATGGTDGSSMGTLAGLSDSEVVDKMADLYAVGTGKTITAEQRTCLHKELDGKFSIDSLNAAITGGTMDSAEQTALGLAFVKCGMA